MRRIIALAASAAAAATVIAAPGAVAAPAECGAEGNPALGVVTVATPAGKTFYVDDRNFVLGNGLWIYEESNGYVKLQRKAGTEATTSTDKVPEGLGEAYDTCTDMAGAPSTAKADTLHF